MSSYSFLTILPNNPKINPGLALSKYEDELKFDPPFTHEPKYIIISRIRPLKGLKHN